MISDVVMKCEMDPGQPRGLPIPPCGLRTDAVENCNKCLVSIRDVAHETDDSEVPEPADELEIAGSPRSTVLTPLDNLFPHHAIHPQGIAVAQWTEVRILARPAGLITVTRREAVRLPRKQVVVPRAKCEAL